MNHEVIESLLFFRYENEVRMVSKRNQDFNRSVVLFNRKDVNQPFANLLEGSGVMYQVLTQEIKALQIMIDNQNVSQELRQIFIHMQNGCLMAQRVAQVGLDKVNDEIKGEVKCNENRK
jgi:hypothetical protein